MKKECIKGDVKLHYSGADKDLASHSISKRLFNVNPYQGKVTEAQFIEEYDYDSLTSTETYNPSFLGDVLVEYSDGTKRKHSLVKVVVTNVQLHDVVSQGEKTFGTLTGTIYAQINNVDVNQIQETTSEPDQLDFSKLFSGILKTLGLLAIGAFLWCFLWGNCSKIWKDCPTCSEPIVVRDTVVVIKENERIVIQTDTIKTDDEGLGTGEVQLSLFWESTEDIDLVVKSPEGYIYFNNKVCGGGRMDRDENAGTPNTNNPVENIFWNQDALSTGKYEVYVLYYRTYTGIPTTVPFELRVRNKNREKTLEGKIMTPMNGAWSENQCMGDCDFSPSMVENLKYSVKVFEFYYNKENERQQII